MIAGVSSQMLGSWVEFVVCAQKQFIMASFVTKKPKLRIISLADEWEEMQLRGRPMQCTQLTRNLKRIDQQGVIGNVTKLA